MSVKKIASKKIPYYLLLFFMPIGASLILGFLSFGGMFALLPLLPLAFAAFFLSVTYEGEIYLQNIKGALDKLGFKRNYLEHFLANEFLLKHFPANLEGEKCPKFFKTYNKLLQRLQVFGHGTLSKESLAKKKKIEKKLRAMEKWFAEQLFPAKNESEEELTDYQKQVREWLSREHKKDLEETRACLEKRKKQFNGVLLFSALTAVFMTLGTTYLLAGEFAAIPLLAAIPVTLLPAIILPMALIAGVAYGLLTYNSVTDLIKNKTLQNWYENIRNDLRKGWSARNVFLAVSSVLLIGLAIGLTICTAGTWWTVVKNAKPLFSWMARIPVFVMGIIHPIITGASALFFNLENTSNSFEIIRNALNQQKSFFSRVKKGITKGWAHLREHENWLQILNPFRLFLKLTVTPLRILFFLGHLISIGVTADRVPGIPEILSALFGIISEGFEDMHYFFGELGHSHDHHHGHDKEDTAELRAERLSEGHGHSHDADLPTRCLKFLLSCGYAIYFLAALWDYGASRLNEEDSKRPVLSFRQAWNKQTGQQEEADVDLPEWDIGSKEYEAERKLFNEWEIEHTLLKINRYEKKHLQSASIKPSLARQKEAMLLNLKEDLKQEAHNLHKEMKPSFSLRERLMQESQKAEYNEHRFFLSRGDTETKSFLSELPDMVVCSAPAA